MSEQFLYQELDAFSPRADEAMRHYQETKPTKTEEQS